MKQWYHSGIEGYCKAAAQAMGLPDNNSGWGNFGRDLFADGRFDDTVKANRTWTLSRYRHLGRSNRPMLFEKSWLGKSGPDCELDAIHACAHSICKQGGNSTLVLFLRNNYLDFAQAFRTEILPAIEDGFRTERYHSASIVRFAQGIDERLGELKPTIPQTFRNFVIPLVAGLIYGPDHAIAQSHANSVTIRSKHDASDMQLDQVDMNTVRITQVYSNDLTHTGYSELFQDTQAVLFGRGGSAENYLAKCDSAFMREIAELEPIVFPVANSHKRVSNEHAALARLGDTWYFHDFSTNGSCLLSADGTEQSVHSEIVQIAPGDRICLGDSKPAGDAVKASSLSMMLLVSFNIEESALL